MGLHYKVMKTRIYLYVLDWLAALNIFIVYSAILLLKGLHVHMQWWSQFLDLSMNYFFMKTEAHICFIFNLQGYPEKMKL